MAEPRTERELFDLVDAWVRAQTPRTRAEALRQRSALTLAELVARQHREDAAEAS